MVCSSARHFSSEMPESLAEEAAGAAGGVEDGLVLLRVEDVHHEPDGGRRREVLASVSAQVVPTSSW